MGFNTPRTQLSIYIVLVVVIPMGLSVESAAFDNLNNATDNSVSGNTATENSKESGIPNSLPSDEHLKEPGDQGISLWRQSPCEAGYPCGPDQWCSPSRQVCRPCSDVKKWCNDSDLIHTSYTACERYCYQLQHDRAVTCELQKDAAQIQLRDTELALDNLTEALEKAHEAKNKAVFLQEKLRKSEEKKTNIVVGLVIALTVTTMWAIAASVAQLRMVFGPERRHRVGTAGEEQGLPSPTEQVDSAPLITTETAKIPVQDNSMDSGEYCGNYGNPGPRVTGDAVVAV